MNDLIEVNSTYNLTNWIGQEDYIKISANHVILDKESVLFVEDGKNVSDQDEPIKIIDVEFKATTLLMADKEDLAFAVFSGLASAGIDYLFVGTTDFSKMNFKDLKVDDVLREMPKIIKVLNLSKENVDRVEKLFDGGVDEIEKKLHNAENYKNMVIDFASGLSVEGLAISIIEQLIGYHIGLDEDGVFLVNKFSDEEIVHEGYTKKIIAGAVMWFISQAHIYMQNGKFKEEKNDILKLNKKLVDIKSLIKKLSDSSLYKDESFDFSELKKEIIKLINNTEDEENKDILDILAMQAIPVVFNRCLVKSYLIIKSLINQIKNKNIKSIEGLKYLDFKLNDDENRRIKSRMNTVSTGVFAAADATHAASIAATKAYVEAMKIAGMPIDNRAKAIMMASVAAKTGICEFASRINISNLVELVTVTKVDWEYIIDDLKHRPDNYTTFSDEDMYFEPIDMSEYTTLNKLETRILYSLEYQRVQWDIYNTKDSQTQIDKDKWCRCWMNVSEQATDINKLFEFDWKKLKALIETYISNGAENNWHRIILELSLFKPYFELEDNLDKKKTLKMNKGDFVLDVICKENKLMSEADYKGLMKNYKKHYEELDNAVLKKAIGVASAVAITAATGGAAFVFAPAIATTLVGGTFAGLYGIALTNASLALIGGGSLAIGGLGMAGGTMIIAGGGALLGLGTSGITLAALSLMTSSEYTKVDYAKLLTNCDYILIGKYGKVKEVRAISKQIKYSVEDYKTRYAVMKERMPVDKQHKKQNQDILKELSKSIDITENSAQILGKIVNCNSDRD